MILYESDGDGDLYLARWESFGFAFRKQVTIRNGVKKEGKHGALINRSAIESHSEIIGNIHESPELFT